MKVSVLGAGGWGTTLANLLYDNKHQVTLWEHNKEYAETLKRYRENFYYLRGVKIPDEIEITNDLEKALNDKEIIVVAVPTQFIRESFSNFRNFPFNNTVLLSASKGIENGSLMFVTEILCDVFMNLTSDMLGCLSGPSHAEEVSRKIPTAVVCAANSLEVSKNIQTAFSNSYFRVYTSDDVKGTEIGGALKNIMAIASGISDGIGYGINTKAALMTRGINEMMKIGLKLNAKMETFLGLSGVGDLIVTCSSNLSRNWYVGNQIGKGEKLNSILKKMKMVAEGISTTKSAYNLIQKLNIEAPIIEEVYRILFEDYDPKQSTENLMTRELKSE